MKRFDVFYDLRVSPGVLEEKCLVVYAINKSEAIHIYNEHVDENAIFRCVKTPLF